jgi:3-hydroxyisobutyrate dehydrogenase-like beta-hydroxyacid dehydrogenase
VHIAVAAEALALGIKAGLDPKTLYDVVTTAAGNSWMFENRVPHILDADETPRSAVDIFVKDLSLVGDLARAASFPAPLAAQAHQLFVAARAMGHGGVDDAFVIRAYQALTGITLPGDG